MRQSPGKFFATRSSGITRFAAMVTFIAGSAVVWLAMPVAAAAPGECLLPDNGTGTADLPPTGCSYVSLGSLHIIDGLPPGTTIEIDGVMCCFENILRTPGGPMGGEVDQYNATLGCAMTGTGALSTYRKNITITLLNVAQAAPRTSGDPVQSFDTKMYSMYGQVTPGDPDFDLLSFTATADTTHRPMPSPGHTTLRTAPGGGWTVDSFFDIEYRIDFIGHPGGPLGGMSGSTTATVRIQSGVSDPVPVKTGNWGTLKAMFR